MQQNGHIVHEAGHNGQPGPTSNGLCGRAVGSVRTAIVHDWLPVNAGAERVHEQMLAVRPDADLYSLIDFLPEEQRAFLSGKPVHTSFLQRLPFAQGKYRYYLPLAPLAIEQFDLSGYDVVISSSNVVAKGVLTSADQLHVSYVHSPIRYAWDLHFPYRKGGGRGMLVRLILHYLRLYDAVAANRVDVFVAKSHHVARRIWKAYRRRAHVIYPPVATGAFTLHANKEDFYVTLSRLVPYKRVDLIVEAFSQMTDKELFVIGTGPEFNRIKAKAGPNVTLLGDQPFEAVLHYLQRARGFVYAAEEGFDVANVQAQACGTPVIAYGRGGVLETVIPGETGVFFQEQSVEALLHAVHGFEDLYEGLCPEMIRLNAERFSEGRFRRAFEHLIDREYQKFVAPSYSYQELSGAVETTGLDL